jgi:hypothetical protein
MMRRYEGLGMFLSHEAGLRSSDLYGSDADRESNGLA